MPATGETSGQKRSAIVVGAGITGLSAALHLQRDGWAVTLLDRIRPGQPGQTSFGNAGILARCAVVPVSTPGLARRAPRMLLDRMQPLFVRWSYLPRAAPWLLGFLRQGRQDRMERIAEALSHLTFDSVDQHRALARGTAAERYVREGPYTYIYRDAAARAADAPFHALRAAHGLVSEDRDRGALAARDPFLAPEFGAGTEFPDHGWISDPGRYIAALFAAFQAEGGQFRQGVVEAIEADPARVIVSGDRLAADKIVLAAGVWSRRLAEALGHRVPMESERGYHLTYRGANIRPPHPYMIAAGKFAMTPMEDSLRVAGVVEFGGTEAPPGDAAFDLLRRYLARVYPGLTFDEEEQWMGHRPSTVDSLPFLGASPRAPDVILAFGSQHIGMTIGPKLGRMVAEIAGGRPGNTDLAPYRVDRFD